MRLRIALKITFWFSLFTKKQYAYQCISHWSSYNANNTIQFLTECLHTPSSLLLRLAFLRVWRSKCYSNATYRNLAKCFYKAGKDKMVTAICEVLQPPASPPSNPQTQPLYQGIDTTCTHTDLGIYSSVHNNENVKVPY